MPYVTIDWIAGRSAEDKAKVTAAVTDSLTGLGIPAEAVWVRFNDVAPENWAIGGKPMA